MAAENNAPDPSPTERFSWSSLLDLGAWLLAVSVLCWERGWWAGCLAVAEAPPSVDFVLLLRSVLHDVLFDGVKTGGESCTGGGCLFLAGEAAAAVRFEDFVPGLVPRFVGAGSGAGEELCSSLSRSGSRTVSLLSVGEGEGEVLLVMPASCHISGALV